MIDSLFVPENCVIHQTQPGTHIRQNKRKFLCKKAYHTYISYGFAQLRKVDNVKRKPCIVAIRRFETDRGIPHSTKWEECIAAKKDVNAPPYFKDMNEGEWTEYEDLWQDGTSQTKRFYSQKCHGSDLKFLSHTARLIDFGEQILEYADLDVQRPREFCKAIKNNEVSETEVRKIFHEKNSLLTKLYKNSILPHSPNWDELKQVLLDCLEMHYGSLSDCVEQVDKYKDLVREIQSLVNKREYL